MTCKIQPINSAIITAYNFEEQTSEKRPKKPQRRTANTITWNFN